MKVSDAIKLLRGDKSRQVFATDLGMSITAIYLYETNDRVPEPKLLMAFIRRAVKSGRADLADVFRVELRRSLGADPKKELVI
jgi:hypothetical protein